MKAVQVTLDDRLLAELDADEEVRRVGRSAVLRRIAAEYLQRRRQETIDRQYRQAYRGGRTVREELEGWEDEGVWPSE